MGGRIPSKAVGRLSVYRRALLELLGEGRDHVYSHQLAAVAGVTPAQVRRDVMAVGYVGSPVSGYDVRQLADSIAGLLDDPEGEQIVLVGVGNLGRAVLAYMSGRRPKLQFAAAFDMDPHKAGRVIHGCRCYPMEQLTDFVQTRGVRVGVITVPAEAAQRVADALISAGVGGLVNFAPVPLRAPSHVHVENMDMTTALEKVAFLARQAERSRKATT